MHLWGLNLTQALLIRVLINLEHNEKKNQQILGISCKYVPCGIVFVILLFLLVSYVSHTITQKMDYRQVS